MAGNTQLSRVDGFKSLLNTANIYGLVKAACGSKEAASQFTSSMLEVYREGGSYLQDCDPNAIIAECLKAAQLNLPLVNALGYAYVVPFKNKNGNKVPTFIVGWRGLVQLAQNSGKYRYINADAVYEGEEVSFDRLSGSIKITGQKTSDKAIGYFAYIQLLDGFEKSVYMTREEMEAYGKKYSASYSKGPWQTEFDAMARKTVLRKILKWGPSSTQMAKAEMFDIQSAQQEVTRVVEAETVTQKVEARPVEALPDAEAETEEPDAPEADPGF